MTTNVLITGIGGSIGIDVARSLRADPDIRIIGCDANEWGLRQTRELVDESVSVPRADRDPRGYLDTLGALIGERDVAFAFVNPDPELEALAALRETVPCPSSMPPIDTVGVTLDKARTVARAGDAGGFPATTEVASEEDLRHAFAALGSPLWMRSAVGAGGRGSLVVEDADEAGAWMRYWNRRGKDYQWVLQEYLPGANINWTGLYVGGELLVTAAMERLAYFLGGTTASGVSGQVSRCGTVDPARYHELCDRVVRALDATPHGVYSVDLRHDARDQPRVTEVNPRLAGRPWLYTNAGVNLPLAVARALTGAAIGDAVASGGLQLGLELYRQLDIDPVVGRPPGS